MESVLNFTALPLAGAYLIETLTKNDARGQFTRLFCSEELQSIKYNEKIVQVNHSINTNSGTVRGMHYQVAPHSEVKFVRCLFGSVFDVIVDLRKDSRTFLKWHAELLTATNMKTLLVPQGCAHGFQTLEDNTQLLYFHTNFYNPSAERGVRYNDPAISIQWPDPVRYISDKDANYPLLQSSAENV